MCGKRWAYREQVLRAEHGQLHLRAQEAVDKVDDDNAFGVGPHAQRAGDQLLAQSPGGARAQAGQLRRLDDRVRRQAVGNVGLQALTLGSDVVLDDLQVVLVLAVVLVPGSVGSGTSVSAIGVDGHLGSGGGSNCGGGGIGCIGSIGSRGNCTGGSSSSTRGGGRPGSSNRIGSGSISGSSGGSSSIDSGSSEVVGSSSLGSSNDTRPGGGGSSSGSGSHLHGNRCDFGSGGGSGLGFSCSIRRTGSIVDCASLGSTSSCSE